MTVPRNTPFAAARKVALALFLAVVPVAPGAAQTDEAARGVPFVTNRDRTGDSLPRAVYGDGRGSLQGGWCDVSETRLDLLAPLADASTLRIPEEILRVAGVRARPPAEIMDAVAASTGDRAPVFYTHGFFIDFDKGCRRATLFQENIRAQGRFLWFSWPSDGAILNYTFDESDLYWSVPAMASAIIDFAARFGPGRLNVAGHSLGARGLALALAEVATRAPDLKLGEVVLLAPDMDVAIFADLLDRLRPLASGITIYVSDNDRPLKLSEQVHGYPRLGQAGNDTARLTGVDVIDLSALPLRSPTGHLYHVYSPAVGADLDQLFSQGIRADARSNMTRIGPNLWQLTSGE